MCGSMADIQSATAKIRRGKKKKEEERNHSQKYNGLPYSIAYGDDNKVSNQRTLYYATSNNLCFRRFFFDKVLRAIKSADTAANPYRSNFIVSYHLYYRQRRTQPGPDSAPFLATCKFFFVDVIGFCCKLLVACCKLQRCKLLVVSFIVVLIRV